MKTENGSYLVFLHLNDSKDWEIETVNLLEIIYWESMEILVPLTKSGSQLRSNDAIKHKTPNQSQVNDSDDACLDNPAVRLNDGCIHQTNCSVHIEISLHLLARMLWKFEIPRG